MYRIFLDLTMTLPPIRTPENKRERTPVLHSIINLMEANNMARKRYTAEQIIGMLREVEILLGQGQTVAHAVKHIGIAEQTYYRWRQEYGGMKVDQAKRLRELVKENDRLKKIVADQALDISILKDISSGNL